MMIEASLSDICDVGVFGDDRAWARALAACRRGLEGHRGSPAEAGHLGVLLAWAGRSRRAADLFLMLETLAATRQLSAGPAARDATLPAVAEAPPSLPYNLFTPSGRNTEDSEDAGDLLAALVLSGRWALARRCCLRMARGSSPRQRGTEGSNLSFAFR